jgi:hypothetical protein
MSRLSTDDGSATLTLPSSECPEAARCVGGALERVWTREAIIVATIEALDGVGKRLPYSSSRGEPVGGPTGREGGG